MMDKQNLNEVKTGRVKYSNPERQFGFIETQTDAGLLDVFFGSWSLVDESWWPRVDDRVAFTMRQATKGWKALDVEIL